jgi:hypothetical protein
MFVYKHIIFVLSDVQFGPYTCVCVCVCVNRSASAARDYWV